MPGEIKKSDGFTLIELMIVVAIIGILAAIAIPNFLMYQTKAKQAEAKSNLNGLFKVEMSYYAENSRYTPEFTGLSWIPLGPYRYAYNMSNDDTKTVGLNLLLTAAKNNDTPGADDVSFTGVAWGDIDGDGAIDTWQVNDRNQLKNTYDDVNEIAP